MKKRSSYIGAFIGMVGIIITVMVMFFLLLSSCEKPEQLNQEIQSKLALEEAEELEIFYELEVEEKSSRGIRKLQYWNTATTPKYDLSEGTEEILATKPVIKNIIRLYYNKPGGWTLNENSINDFNITFVHKRGLEQPTRNSVNYIPYVNRRGKLRGWFRFDTNLNYLETIVDFKSGENYYHYYPYLGPGQSLRYTK